VGANTAFLKHEAAAQYNVSFNPFQQSAAFGSLFSLGMSASVGHLHSISGTGSDGTCINDRFFSGGANSLRGFEADGVGPHGMSNSARFSRRTTF
jgi:outer membrane protein assembly factor BamA